MNVRRHVALFILGAFAVVAFLVARGIGLSYSGSVGAVAGFASLVLLLPYIPAKGLYEWSLALLCFIPLGVSRYYEMSPEHILLAPLLALTIFGLGLMSRFMHRAHDQIGKDKQPAPETPPETPAEPKK